MNPFTKKKPFAGHPAATNLPPVRQKVLATLWVLLLCALLAACDSSDPGEEGGIIGTGITIDATDSPGSVGTPAPEADSQSDPDGNLLRGTASTQRAISANQIEIKSSDGQNSLALLAAGNRFLTDTASGTGPWVLRASLGEGIAIYGISYADGPSNINSYSDVILRNWFARQGVDLDNAFNSIGSFTSLPTQAQFNQESSSLFSLYSLLLDSNGVNGQVLLSGDFAADDQGNDRFLDRNPVVIEDNRVSVLITDPDRNTQSSVRSNLDLGTDLDRLDSIAPSVPGSVRSLGSATDEIVVVWEPSTDDLVVQGYQVFRDGVLIASTPYPVYIDEGLALNQVVTYEIAAFDASGNLSARSMVSTGTTLAAADTSAPPTPTGFSQLGASNQRVELIWGQTDIADVAAFNLYRATDGGIPGFLLTVTSTFATDFTISGAGTYCYQVTAEDASGNESALTDVLCVTVDGTGNMVSGGGNSVPVSSSASFQELGFSDPDSIACNSSLAQADLLRSISLPAGCYSVTENLLVPAFVRLSLDAGVTLKFGAGLKLEVGRDAALVANGTLDAPVVFTGEFSSRGYWEGIEFNFSDSPVNLLRNSLVQYAGGGELSAAVVVRSADGSRSRIRIENSLIRFSANAGLSFVGNGLVVESFSGNRITGNVRPAFFEADLMEVVAGTTDFTGNDFDEVSFPRNTYSKNIMIPDPGVIVRSNGLVVESAALTLGAGLNLLMDGNSRIRVDDGAFTAVGTTDSPITLTARFSPWNGIQLSGRGDKQINHLVIEDAGVAGDGNGAIELECTERSPASLSIQNTDISNSLSYGIALSPVGCTLELGSNVTFFNNLLGDINR